MTELLKKDKKFEWMPSCEASFPELKKRPMTALILVMWRSHFLFIVMRLVKD
jgi:hypothetical protein